MEKSFLLKSAIPIFKVEKKYFCSKKWTNEEDNVILKIGNTIKRNKWVIASKILNRKKSIECYYRYKSINPKYKKGRWTIFEDQKLLRLINLFGKNWKLISKILKNRSNRQIKNRHNIYHIEYNSSVFTKHEDNFILKVFDSLKDEINLEKKFDLKFKQKIKSNKILFYKGYAKILKRLNFLINKRDFDVNNTFKNISNTDFSVSLNSEDIS